MPERARFQIAKYEQHQWELQPVAGDNLGQMINTAVALSDALGDPETGILVIDHDWETWAAHVRLDDSDSYAVAYNPECTRVTRLHDSN